MLRAEVQARPRVRLQNGRLPEPRPAAVVAALSPGAMLAWALWVGLATGLTETAIMFGVVAQTGVGAGAFGALQMNRHALWMITCSDAVMFTAVGAVLAGLIRLVRVRRVAQLGWWALVALSCFALLQMAYGLTMLAVTSLALGLAACVARRLNPAGPRMTRIRRLTTPLLLVSAIALIPLHYLSESHAERSRLGALAPPRAGAPNILLVVLDTVRADALSCYGYHRPTTPNLDRLAARGIRFEHARAPGAWTLPSHASMFTGRWPHELSARVNRPLDHTFPTIAEHLGNQGYETAGFIANTFFCNAWFGLGRGFAHYDDVAPNLQTVLRTSHLGRRVFRHFATAEHERPASHFSRKDAATINSDLLRWLDQRDESSRPFFVFLNYFDAHDPYLMPKREAPPFGQVASAHDDIHLLRHWNLLEGKALTPRQLSLARDCYDDCLAQLDREFGRLVEQLDERGLLSQTWIVVTSDHGEQFGEHGLVGHGNSVHRQTVHVPLLIVPPANQLGDLGSTITPPVSLRDVPATLVDLAGVPQPTLAFPGRSLRRFWGDQASAEDHADEVVYSEIVDHAGPPPPGWKRPRALVSEGFVYIRHHDDRESLFELATDPDELNDLAPLAEHAERLLRFRDWSNRFDPD